MDEPSPPTEIEYDFVVVGGGTAGLVVACRLSENPKVHVLVLEAGSDRMGDPRINVPALWLSVKGDPDFDWSLQTTPQANLQERCIPQPQGRVLGGSSAINAEAMIAPSRAALDAKFRTITFPSEPICRHLGIEYAIETAQEQPGPIQGSFQETLEDPISKAWVETFENLHFKVVNDPFSGDAVGGFNNPITVDPISKCRSYAASAYYAPVKGRSNLHVFTEATVEKIMLEGNGEDLTASGVQYTRHGTSLIVKARKEVILAAGALQSPKMLELSGIGAAELLRSYDIPVLFDNPYVGENLQDHLFAAICFEVNDGVPTKDGLYRKEPGPIQKAMTDYKTSLTGPFCVGGVVSFAVMPVIDFLTEEGQATQKHLLDRLVTNPPEELPPAKKAQYSFLRSILENTTEGSGSFFLSPVQASIGADLQGVLPGNFVTLAASQLNAFSRGSVHISSNDPSHQPIIDPKYLSHPMDVEIFARHLLYLETIASTQPFVSLLKPGGTRTTVIKNLDVAQDYIRSYAQSNWHPTSTCPMMPKEMGGVVNERLLVYGTRNLRVVDASIMPIISRGNPQTTVYAVAERAADLIKEDFDI